MTIHNYHVQLERILEVGKHVCHLIAHAHEECSCA